MITPRECWLLDTNVWVFGLRRHPGAPECAELLDRIGEFGVVIPLQILKELNLNLTEHEINEFYRLINQQPEWIELSWTRAAADRIEFYERFGCRKGDAVIAAHAESLAATTIVSENRQFLRAVKDLEINILTAADALERLA